VGGPRYQMISAFEKMRYNRNAAETFYQLFTSALRNAPA
jgi:hypothetical protein